MRHTNILKHFAIIAMAIGSLLLLSSHAPSSNSMSNDKEDLELLQMIVDEMQSELPLDIGAGMKVTDIYMTSTHFVMEYTCSDNIIELMRLGIDNDSKAEFIEGVLTDESSALLLSICANTNIGARFTFNNRSYSSQLRIEYSAKELAYYLK